MGYDPRSSLLAGIAYLTHDDPKVWKRSDAGIKPVNLLEDDWVEGQK